MDRRDQRPDAWQSLGGRDVSETLFIAASRAGISVARQAGESRNVEAVACAPTGDLQGARRRRDPAGVCGCQTLHSLLPRGADDGHQSSSSLFQLGV